MLQHSMDSSQTLIQRLHKSCVDCIAGKLLAIVYTIFIGKFTQESGLWCFLKTRLLQRSFWIDRCGNWDRDALLFVCSKDFCQKITLRLKIPEFQRCNKVQFKRSSIHIIHVSLWQNSEEFDRLYEVHWR